jgi:hypothetical protein
MQFSGSTAGLRNHSLQTEAHEVEGLARPPPSVPRSDPRKARQDFCFKAAELSPEWDRSWGKTGQCSKPGGERGSLGHIARFYTWQLGASGLQMQICAK